MNDINCIIISSDEETNTNTSSLSKAQEFANTIEGKVKPAEHGADSSTKHYSILRSSKQEKAHCSQLSTTGRINPCASKNTDSNISRESQGAPIYNHALKDPKYCTRNAKTATKVEPDHNEGIENDNMEMSSTFTKFLELVISMEEKEDDKVKLQKKITKYHNLADPKYLKSNDFHTLLENSMNKLVKDPAFLYFVIKEILDSLLAKRVLNDCKKIKNMKSSDTGRDIGKENCEDDSEKKEGDIFFDEDINNYKNIKKLSKFLRKLEKKIKELEETEVDLSDEEDSVYLKMQRYRERYCQIYKKLCSYTKQAANAKRACTRKISFNGTNNLQLDRAIETWLNKTMQFPDYASVLKFLRESNDNLQLGMSEGKIKKLAIDVFVKIGNSMQLRRKYDLWDSLNAFLDNRVDPSTSDVELKERLDSNFEIAVKKEKEILDYYADLQAKRRLQPAEVPDEEANESPVESGDEDENELEAVENEMNSKIPDDIDCKDEESDAEENGQQNCRSLLESDDETMNVDSEKSDASVKPICVPNYLYENKNEESSKQSVTNSGMCTSVPGAFKNCNGKDAESYYITMLTAKRSAHMENGKRVKKTKLTEAEKCNDDSDCELIVLLSDEETSKSETDDNFKVRRVHQINYAFINNNFNHNATLTTDDLILKRKNSSFNFKSGKTRRKFLQLPLSDVANMKHIMNKYAQVKNGLEKRKFQETIRLHPFEISRFRYSQLILPDKISNHCVLHKKSDRKNVKVQNKSDKVNNKDSREQNSLGEEIRKPNGGGPNAGAGEDNNGDNGNKKPSKQKKRAGRSEAEDEDEDDEDDKDENKVKEIHLAHRSESTLAESNINKSVSQHVNRNCETPSKGDSSVSYPQLRGINTNSPPQSKRKSVTSNAKRSLNDRVRLHKNGGPLGTSRFVSVKYPFICKSYVGHVKIARGKSRQVIPLNLSEVEKISVYQKMKSTSLTIAKSDEEIVNNFLQHSPSSVSITIPRKRLIQNKPSSSICQAIQTLSRLKGITATVVKGSSPEREEEIVVMGESLRSAAKRSSKPPLPKSRQNQSFLLPKIVAVQGNASGFENHDSDGAITNFPDNKTTRLRRRRARRPRFRIPTEVQGNNSCSPRLSKSTMQQPKNVEYVVLD